MLTSLKQETFLLLALVAALVAYPLEHVLLNSGQGVALGSGLVLIGFIVAASMRVAHHAELLAEKVGDPYGTMILTLAAVLVEVVILAIMMSNEASPTLVFRVLQGPLRDTLVDMARPDGRLAQIRRATEWIRQHYAEPFRVEPLAAMTDMSVAAFYRHFKAITAMTPIQYQKRLRLLRARWLLLFDTLDAASIAFTVGYESASQFSREYARLFGLPPVKDAARFKSHA